MASKNRYSAPGLIDQARAEPWRFGFFQLVRLLRLHYSRNGRIDPENRPHQDPLRFRSLLSLNFPPSEISDLRFESVPSGPAGDAPLSEVQVTFMGLVGPSGVLPRPYTELLINRHMEKRDDAAHAFMDFFSHRMTALFYEAWQKYRFHIEYERKGSAAFEDALLHLTGLTLSTMDKTFADNESATLRRELFDWFSGFWTQRPRNAGNLQSMLEYTFRQPCHVSSFAGRWINLERDQYTCLGQSNARLGESAIAGTRVRDYQSTFRITFGPLSLEAYEALLPGTDQYHKLVRMTRFYVGIELDFQVELILDRDAIPEPQLGATGNVRPGHLGWLKSGGHQPRAHGHAIFDIFYDGATA